IHTSPGKEKVMKVNLRIENYGCHICSVTVDHPCPSIGTHVEVDFEEEASISLRKGRSDGRGFGRRRRLCDILSPQYLWAHIVLASNVRIPSQTASKSASAAVTTSCKIMKTKSPDSMPSWQDPCFLYTPRLRRCVKGLPTCGSP